MMYRLNSSYRSVSPEETLARAKRMAPSLGITRVTDTTRLDRIGIPVYASIRPDAADGSICVCAGKGVRGIEAQVGAYMEAIEFAVAERSPRREAVYSVDARDVLGRGSRSAIADLCPVQGVLVDLDEPVECVDGEDLLTGRTVPLPSELVFFPYSPRTGQAVFASSTNGLASGNTVAEATLHALLEVIERDITAFQRLHRDARRVRLESLPAACGPLFHAIAAAGCDVSVRNLPNEFGIPMFEVYVRELAGTAFAPMAGGFGCHVDAQIALVRATTEACQSRLSMIHGGRDDLVKSKALAEGLAAEAERVAVNQFARLATQGDLIAFDDVSSVMSAPSLDAMIAAIVERLTARGIDQLCRVVLTAECDPLQVVRVIVPKLEFQSGDFRRLGPRFLRQAHARIA